MGGIWCLSVPEANWSEGKGSVAGVTKWRKQSFPERTKWEKGSVPRIGVRLSVRLSVCLSVCPQKLKEVTQPWRRQVGKK